MKLFRAGAVVPLLFSAALLSCASAASSVQPTPPETSRAAPELPQEAGYPTANSNSGTANFLLPWVPAVAAIFTAFAAFGALWNARNSRLALEANRNALHANLLAGLVRDYSSDEFRAALKCLRDFSKRPDFVNEYRRLIHANDPSVEEVDKARRRLARYFAAIRTFTGEGLLNPQLIASAFGLGDLRFVVKVLVPIDAAHQEARGDKYDGKTQRFFEQLLSTLE